jgi:hypothetical protein
MLVRKSLFLSGVQLGALFGQTGTVDALELLMQGILKKPAATGKPPGPDKPIHLP